MKATDSIRGIYRENINEADGRLAKAKKKIYRTGSLRFLLFTAGITGIIFTWGNLLMVPVIAVTFIPFLYLVNYHARLFRQREYLERKIEINRQEISALDGDLSSFDGGQPFIDPAHLYTYDLDIFGEQSLFQAINRTSTLLGKEELADWLKHHLRQKEEIEQRQEAIKELASDLKFRQHFRILGLLYQGETANAKEIIEWAKSPGYFKRNRLFRRLPAAVLAINSAAILLAILHLIPSTVAGLIFVAFAFSSALFTKKISRMQELYGRKMKVLASLSPLIRTFEERAVQAPLLKAVKQLLVNGKAASKEVGRLVKLLDALDQRGNVLLTFLLNGLFFWELRQAIKIEHWKEKTAPHLPQWLEAVKKIDALCSLSTFAYNHPEYAYPTIDSAPFTLTIKAAGHPLMDAKKCVRNDFGMSQSPYFIIVTGANMAGKSTYLRTIGVNYLLACIGCPVCGKEMSLHPNQLITSLRTSDSLSENESYFFAELKRLQLIIRKLHNGEKLFIILDEILKGTNSVDKQKGSLALIEQLIRLQTNGVIATHDLLLGTLKETFPANIRNYCFEADIVDNELHFSYRLREGIAQNMNACFLMNKMGITVPS